MIIALPVWNGRISPVFDTANTVWIVTVDADRSISKREVSMTTPLIAARAAKLASLGVQYLICGGISTPQAMLVKTFGIQVVPWIGGNADEIVAAFLDGCLSDARFQLPGRCAGSGRRRRRRGRFGR